MADDPSTDGRRSIREQLSLALRSGANWHRPGDAPNVLLVTTPRSGSTWLMEMIAGQPGFKVCNEPLNVRHPDVRAGLGISDWDALYAEATHARLERYFADIASGRIRRLNPSPRARQHRFRSSRVVFKVLHGGEDHIAAIARAANARVVLLLRHPIAVSISREVLPRLETFVRSDYARHFSPDELAAARKIVATGSQLERAMLDWCLQNVVPLRMRDPAWRVVSYEQLVLEPDVVLEALAPHLELPDRALLMRDVERPSLTSNKSDAETAEILATRSGADRARELVGKWRRRVEPEAEAQAMRVLAHFGCDAYSAGRDLPDDALWLRAEPVR